MGCKYDSNDFRFCCGFSVVLVCIAWIEATAVLTSNPHPSVTVTGRISYTNSKFEYMNSVSVGEPWYRAGQQRMGAHHYSDCLIWDSSLHIFLECRARNPFDHCHLKTVPEALSMHLQFSLTSSINSGVVT